MVQCIYSDLSSTLVTEKEVRRDLETIRLRVSSEGVSFLTKTLPQFAKAVDGCLSNGSQLNVTMFRKERGSKLPQFMRTLLKLLFSSDGYPLPDATSHIGTGELQSLRCEAPPAVKQADALRAIRQICYLFYKLEIPPTKAQTNEVLTTFVATETEVWDGLYRAPGDVEVERIARSLCHRVLNSADPHSGIPRHGPGSVATGERPAEKHVFSRWYSLLTEVFPYDQWFAPNQGAVCDYYHRLEQLESHETGTAKVVLVPKDSRGPRLISCEPLEYQWVQQALNRVMTDAIESHRLTRGHVNFTDQETNRRLALEGSRTGKWVTLDMKEASDRVSVHHVAGLFPDRWCEALFASRTTHTMLPDGRKVHLKKMSPMGSAVCFPIESIVFWSLCVAQIALAHKLSLREALGSVYVYGDDIVIRSAYHATVSSALERFGLKTNPQKCCTQGPFRESCGMDAYKGFPVAPIRCKQQWSSRRSPAVLSSWVALSNNLWSAGYWACANYVQALIEDTWGFTLPRTPSVIGCLSFVRPELPSKLPVGRWRRYNKHLHRTEIRGLSTRPTSEMTRTFGYPLLLRVLTDLERRKKSAEPTDAMHRAERRRSNRSIALQDTPITGALTGEYPIVHRNKLCRTWTPCPH